MILEKIVKQEIIFYVMSILLGFGVLAKFVSAVTIRRMVKAAGEIQKSNHRLMRLIKAKFEHMSMISDRVQNVEAFVEKYVYEYKVLGVRLHTWQAVPKHMLWIIAMLGVFAGFESYRLFGFGDLLMKYVQWTGLFMMLLGLLYFVAEENKRLKAAKNYIVEYLENICIHRYAIRNKGAEEETEEGNAEENVPEPQAPEEAEESKEIDGQEMRIRAILEEFLA